MSKTYAIGWLSHIENPSYRRARRRRVVKRQNDTAKCHTMDDFYHPSLSGKLCDDEAKLKFKD